MPARLLFHLTFSSAKRPPGTCFILVADDFRRHHSPRSVAGQAGGRCGARRRGKLAFSRRLWRARSVSRPSWARISNPVPSPQCWWWMAIAVNYWSRSGTRAIVNISGLISEAGTSRSSGGRRQSSRPTARCRVKVMLNAGLSPEHEEKLGSRDRFAMACTVLKFLGAAKRLRRRAGGAASRCCKCFLPCPVTPLRPDVER